MDAKRHRARALAATALLLLPLLSWAAGPASARGLSIDAPGWSIVDPDNPNAASIAVGRGAGDVTGDGRDDLLVSYNPSYIYKTEPPYFFSNTTFELYGGTAGGVKGPALSSSQPGESSYFVFDYPVTFPRASIDFNGDGLADTVYTGFVFTDSGIYQSRAEIFYGSADGFATSPDCTIALDGNPRAGSSWSWMPGGDFDKDGKSDLLVLENRFPIIPPPRDPNGNTTTTDGGDKVRMFRGDPCGATLMDGPDVSAKHGGTMSFRGHGDFNGDGYEDAVVDETVYGSGTNVGHFMTVLPGSALGVSNSSATTITFQAASSTQFAVGVDLQSDGYADIAMMLGYQAGFAGEFFDIAVFSGGPSSIATSASPAQTMGGTGLSGASGSFGDFDGDGSLDLALIHSNTTQTPTNVTLDLFFGNRGTFARAPDWTSSITVTMDGAGFGFNAPATLDASGDYDGDGLADLAVVISSPMFFPLAISPYNTTSDSAILFYYGKDIVRDVSAVVMVGFDKGVGYPTYVQGWDYKQKAANFSSYDRFVLTTGLGVLYYDVPNATFVWEPNASLPAVEILSLSNLSSVTWDETAKAWDIHFRVVFAWSFPTEDEVPFDVKPMKGATAGAPGRGAAGEFRVEKDFAFVGDLRATNVVAGGSVPANGWVAGGTSLRLQGLAVVFEGTLDRTVPSSAYTWSLMDDDGTSWSAAAGPLDATITADAGTDEAENVSLSLVGLPDPGVSSPSAAFPFRVDADVPTFAGAIPDDTAWRSNKSVVIGIIVVDPFSGVDPTTIEYQVSPSGSGSFGGWLAPTVDASAPRAVRARATALFENGNQNLFHFRAKDLVGNGYSQSPDFVVRVDTLHLTFLNPTPLPDVWQRNASVLVSILVRDLGASGVDASTIAYRVSTDDVFSYGPWINVSGYANGVDVTPAVTPVFAEGDANYVQWRAQDVVGTGLTVSEHYRNQVDATAPAFAGSTPNASARQTSDRLTVSINASDGQPRAIHQSGLDPSNAQFRFRPAGGNFSNWTAVGLTVVPLDGYNWSLRATITAVPGPGNQVEFRVSDIAGNGPVLSATLSFHVNRGPSAAIVSNAVNGSLYSDTPLNLTARLDDADGDNLTFEWRNAEGDVLSNSSLNLSLVLLPGNYTYEVIVRDGFRATARANFTVVVTTRPPPPLPPPPPPPVTTAPGDSAFFALILLVSAAAAAAVIVWSRRRRAPPAT